MLSNQTINQLATADRAVHDWYRFVLSFPPHLVRDYLDRFDLPPHATVLDPFCGTGTTPVECQKRGLTGVGFEAHPFTHFAAQTKMNWAIDPQMLLNEAEAAAQRAYEMLRSAGIDEEALFYTPPSVMPSQLRTLPPESQALLLTNSMSPLPLHKALILRDCIEQIDQPYRSHALLAFADACVHMYSNVHFGPEIGVRAPKQDVEVIEPWLNRIRRMASDIAVWGAEAVSQKSVVILHDARSSTMLLAPGSIDAVFTSPPYPNEKDYTRTTRLESVLLGFMHTKADLRQIKHGLMRSNTRNVYAGDDEDQWVAQFPVIQDLADRIEARRIELKKTSGFERLYARVTRLYFGGMARHLAELRPYLRKGALLGYVVGDQASYLRVMIRTGELLAMIAESLGYEVVNLDLFRTRLATATKEQLREEVLVLRWKGDVS